MVAKVIYASPNMNMNVVVVSINVVSYVAPQMFIDYWYYFYRNVHHCKRTNQPTLHGHLQINIVHPDILQQESKTLPPLFLVLISDTTYFSRGR